MPIKNSGPSLSFSEIVAEFGLPPGRNLGAYRVSQNVGTLTNLPLDIGIPQSGSISFGNFYSKKLNVVVDLYSIPNYSSRMIARSRYNDNNVVVIGGFRGRPSSSAGIRVIINVNNYLGSDKSSINAAALRTGGWEGNTQLELELGTNSRLFGAGGDGGNANSGAGQPGSSALGIEYPTIIRNNGYIQAGGGGGGASSSINDARRSRTIATRRRSDTAYGGNGGGGGGGIPRGEGGSGGPAGEMEHRRAGVAGRAARNQFSGGDGGSNGSGRDGGSGGDFGANGNAGGSGGQGGSQGRAIIFYNDGSGSSITNLGTINGPIIFNTTPT